MNTIIVNTKVLGFDYDIHSLVKAFYHDADVKVINDDTNVSSSDGMPDIFITQEENNIYFTIVLNDKNQVKKTILDNEDRTYVKNALKQLIYVSLSEFNNISLPWGTLTGIRPTKIARTLLDEGANEDDISSYMKDVYLLSDEKLKLSIDIAKREKALLDTLHVDNGYSLYIGIPFCPTTCLYCSFTSYPICSYENMVSDYLDALSKELDYVNEEFKDKILDTVYIGGGTPTTLKADELDILLNKITSNFKMDNVLEFTVEAGRADSITIDKLKVLKKYNVNRISVNPQTMNQKTLDMIGRRHTVDDVIRAYNDAKALGFENINMDIILGLPGEDVDEVNHTINEIKKLNPDSLTVHSLAIKRASKLAQWIQTNGITALNNTDETMKIASKGALDMDMVPYYLYRQKNMSGNFENVGYSKEDKFGIYNILIMEEVQTIVACGAGTVTKRVYGDGRIERCDDVKDVKLYIEKIDEMIDRKRQLFAD